MVRGQRVVLASDLAALLGVPTRYLNEAVKRNIDRFPSDFRFQLTREEHGILISQIVISKPQQAEQQNVAPNRSQFATGSSRHRDPRFLPFAFNEHGALMAATILRNPRAVAMSVYVVRAFVRMREALLTNAIILKRLAQIEKNSLSTTSCCRMSSKSSGRWSIRHPRKSAAAGSGFTRTLDDGDDCSRCAVPRAGHAN
jgi:hypothetical protein